MSGFTPQCLVCDGTGRLLREPCPLCEGEDCCQMQTMCSSDQPSRVQQPGQLNSQPLQQSPRRNPTNTDEQPMVAQTCGRIGGHVPSQQQGRIMQPSLPLRPIRQLRPLVSGNAELALRTRRGASTLDGPSEREQHAFLDAAKNNRFAQVRQFVLATPSFVNCQPAGRWSALHQAAQFGNVEAVTFLLEHGASVTVRTRDGLTPLDVAKPSVFELLHTAANFDVSSECSRSGVSEEIIRCLPTSTFSRSCTSLAELGDGHIQCQICLADFEEGDELRNLHCSHSFHTCCVDVWLREKSGTCPTCRQQVR